MHSNAQPELAGSRPAFPPDKPNQIERRWWHFALRQQHACLAAVMRLRVVHMSERQAQRRLEAVTAPIAIHQRLVKHSFREAGDEIAQMRILRNARDLEAR